MAHDFWENVRERAYFKYLARKSMNIPDDTIEDWNQAFRDQVIEDRINEEAYYHYLNGCPDPDMNWQEAYREINDRINFLAFYQHTSNINKTPLENWVDAQKIFVHNF